MDRGERLSTALIKRARSAHFAALAAVALVAATAHVLTWQSFSGYRDASDVVALLNSVVYDTNEVTRYAQSLADGEKNPNEAAWYRHRIDSLMNHANVQQARLAVLMPQVFPEAMDAAERFADSEVHRKRIRNDVAQVVRWRETGGHSSTLELLGGLNENTERYNAVSSRAVQLLRDASEARMDRTRVLGFLGVMLVILGLLMEGHFLFRPLVDRLAKAIRFERERQEIERENANLARLQRATEEAYREVESHRKALQTQTEALEVALRKAEEASRLKSEFLANMSHEIRTPLNGVVGMTEILSTTSLTEQQRESVQTISVSAEALLRIINDILDLSKVEAGKLMVEPVRFGLRQLLESIVDIHSKSVAEKGLRLSVQIKEGSENELVGDSSRIRQIVMNLVSNAVKFTNKGSIDIGAETFHRDGRLMLRVEVKDTGIGIDPERLPALFEPFTQADGSTTRMYGGTGLGLAIVKQLSELMGGWTGATSEPGKGSQFWFVVEIERAASGTKPEPRATSPAKVPTGLRVLLVEDNAVNRLVGIRLLEAEDCRVTVAEDGIEALQKFRDNDYDLVLMDVHMPGMDGLQATEAIREFERGRGRRTPIIAMTADAMEREVRRALHSGMDDCLSKPVRSAELRGMLARWADPVGTA